MKLTLQELFLRESKKKSSKKLTLESVYLAPKGLKEQEENDILNPRDEAMLNALERETEIAINKSVGLEESVEHLEEKMSAGGFEYENTVISALMAAKAAGNIKKGAGASAAAADADMNVFGKVFDVEIKLNRNAQMGGSSVRYNKAGGINLVSPLEEDTEALLVDAVKSKSKEINALLDYLAQQDPENVNARAVKFPMSCTKDAWNKAQQAKKLVNTKIPLTADFIAKHYAKKGIFYIQIGGSGLFYLSKNPANLPVPKLEGNVMIEIRSARSGSRVLASGVRVVGAGIRVQGRLKAKNSSPFTLDDPNSIREMLATAKGKKKAGSKKPKRKAASKPKQKPAASKEVPRKYRPRHVGAGPSF